MGSEIILESISYRFTVINWVYLLIDLKVKKNQFLIPISQELPTSKWDEQTKPKEGS